MEGKRKKGRKEGGRKGGREGGREGKKIAWAELESGQGRLIIEQINKRTNNETTN